MMTCGGGAYPGYFASGGRANLKPNGFLGGVQGGYNLQIGNFLWGIEGDAQYMRLKASRDTGVLSVAAINDDIRFIENVEANSLFTLRLRGGVVSHRTLLYATGGLAVTRFKFSRQIGFPIFSDNFVGSVSSTRVGWTAGGGFEHALAPDWTAKAEYLYADFGGVSVRGRDPQAPAVFFDSRAKLSTHILRFGINRKL